MVFGGRKKFLSDIAKLESTTLLYDKDNIVIIEVKSFNDCNKLFNHKSICWCIAQSEKHWNHYIVEKPFSHQYFIIDFNDLNQPDFRKQNYSLIGFTYTNGNLSAAHSKNDENLLSDYQKEKTGLHPFEKILKNKGIYSFVKSRKVNKGAKESITTASVLAIIIAFIIFGVCYLCTAVTSRVNDKSDKKKEAKVSAVKNNKIILGKKYKNIYYLQ